MGSRTQPLVDNFSAYLSVSGQYAGTPLVVAGPRAFCARALDPMQLLADSSDAGFSVAKALEVSRGDERRFFIQSTHG